MAFISRGFNNTAFFTITRGTAITWENRRRFNLGFISDTLSQHFATDYNQLFINKITSLTEIDDKNGWLDYNIGGGRTLRITMIDGVCTFDEQAVHGEDYVNPNYDENNYNQWEEYLFSYDTEANEETYEGWIVYDDEDVPPPYEENDMNLPSYQ